MAVVDQSAFAALMKTRFMKVSRALFEEMPLYAMLDRDESAGGTDMKYPIETQALQGTASDLPSSIDSETAGANYAWDMTLQTTYTTGEIQATTWRRAEGSQNSFVDMLADTAMKAMRGAQLEQAGDIFRSSTGVRGRVDGTVSSDGVVTLQNPDDIYIFYKDMRLQASATPTGAALGQTAYVVGIDYNDGTFVLSNTYRGTPMQPTGWSGSDLYLFRYGTKGKKISGLDSWIPTTKPLPTDPLFFSVPRWEDSTLYGTYVDGAKYRDSAAAFINLAGRLRARGAKPKLGVMTYTSWNNLANTFQGTVPYETVTTTAGISFESIVLRTDAGKVNVIPDPRCNPKTGWLLDPSTIELLSVGSPVGVLKYPDRQVPYIILQGTDVMQLRVGGDIQLIVKVPGYNGRVALQS
jgi:hypothetical protein